MILKDFSYEDAAYDNAILARQMRRWWEGEGKPSIFRITKAGDGLRVRYRPGTHDEGALESALAAYQAAMKVESE